ncbi:MAG TPA: c-type cytochrome [Meiothermus sp.]|nr:c-type cytochrome [Meiothermus sp.]
MISVWRKALIPFIAVSFIFQANADDSQDPDVLIAQSPTYGQYLTDFKGRPLYLYTKDTKDESTCYEQCATNWPPLTFQDKSHPVAGKGLNEKLIGYTKRKDGKSQITYNDWPLYYFAKDQKSGDFNGQGVGGNWFLVSPKGEAIRAAGQAQQPATQTQQIAQAQQTQPAQQPKAADAEAIAKLKAEGQPIFAQYCAACHGAEGKGGTGPNLVGVSPLKNTSFVARQIIGGGEQMPAFGSLLNDHQVAAVGTFVRNSWGNDFGIVTEEDAKAARK